MLSTTLRQGHTRPCDGVGTDVGTTVVTAREGCQRLQQNILPLRLDTRPRSSRVGRSPTRRSYTRPAGHHPPVALGTPAGRLLATAPWPWPRDTASRSAPD